MVINNNYSRKQQRQQKNRCRRHPRSPSSDSSVSSEDSSSSSYSSDNSINGSCHNYNRRYHKIPFPARSQYVALDCEMVGTLTGKSAAARVVVVNWKGETIYDEYVLPDEQVTDYRTFVSGVTAQDLEQHGKPLSVVRSKVLNLLRGKILVGHALSNDLKCLDIAHPWYLQRDTAYYGPFMQRRERENGHSVSLPRKLRILTAERLGRQIQVPGKAHCPAEDAIAALDLYKYERQQWELFLQQHLEEISRYQRLQQLQMQYEQQQYFQQQNLHRHHQRYLQQQFFRLHQPLQERQ